MGEVSVKVGLGVRSTVAAVVLLAASVAAGAAETPACARYTLDGVAPQQDWNDVRRRLVGEPVPASGEDPDAPSVLLFPGTRGTYEIHFDRRIADDPTARVNLVVRRVRVDDPDAAIAELVRTYGPPTGGEDTFAGGVLRWLEPECGVEIEATRRPGDWWDPGSTTLEVRMRAVTLVVSPGGASPAPEGGDAPATNAAAVPGAPAAPTAPEAAPAASRSDDLSATRSAAGGDVPAPRAGLEPPREGDAYTAGVGGVTYPERLPGYRMPAFPREIAQRGFHGRVSLRALVSRDGAVTRVDPTTDGEASRALVSAAIEAVRSWRYRPAKLDGRPVDAWITVVIAFGDGS